MTDERRLSTSDIAAADRHDAETAERERIEQNRNERDLIEPDRQQAVERQIDRDRPQAPRPLTTASGRRPFRPRARAGARGRPTP